MLNATVTARSRLQTPEQFRDIMRQDRSPTARRCCCRDVARVELGSENYSTVTRAQRPPRLRASRCMLAPGADALETAELVQGRDRRQRAELPAGLRYAFPRDSTAFIQLSIEEVVKTLIEAILLVVVVMFVFLQSWRATLIPAIAVPVVLLGTFGVLAVFGFTINTLTLFGLVLAIGLLVDDAIVVVENVERVMREEPGISAARGDAAVDGRDPDGADRDRAGAVGGVPADGVLRRVDRRHLPAVLHHHRLVDGAVGRRRAGAHAGAGGDAAASRRASSARRERRVRAARCGDALQRAVRAHGATLSRAACSA